MLKQQKVLSALLDILYLAVFIRLITTKSSNFIKFNSFLLYHPPYPNNYLISSIEGYAPVSSLEGIFKSSIKSIIFFPISGPYTPFLLL